MVFYTAAKVVAVGVVGLLLERNYKSNFGWLLGLAFNAQRQAIRWFSSCDAF